MLQKSAFSILIRKSLQIRREYHQFKPRDKLQAYDAPLPHDLQAHAKDILLFRYEDPMKIFRGSALALAMFPMWSYLSYFTFQLRSELSPYKDSDVLDKKGKGWVYQDTIYKATRFVGIACFINGIALTGYWANRAMKTVRRVVLRKGGKYVTIVTYGLLGFTSRYTTKAVSHCSVVRQSYQSTERILLNVKGHRFRYQFNVEDGIFSNKPLFDRTIGQIRVI